jgi:4-hydroxy-3-polyprenylbenzoate decarboxylase
MRGFLGNLHHPNPKSRRATQQILGVQVLLLAAAIASGSYPTRGMVILPASMGTVGRIASGVALDLIDREADVHLKERRPLVISPRELPWNLVHLRNLTTLAEAGARIAPPVPAWYHQPRTIDEMVDFLVIRVFDSLGLELGQLNRWQGPPARPSST